MSDSSAFRRFPELVRGFDGIKVWFANNVWNVGVDLDSLYITPTDAAAPVKLADTIATLVAANTGTRNITVCDGGFYDVPNSGNGVTIDGGWF